jgi:hypothetical protein
MELKLLGIQWFEISEVLYFLQRCVNGIEATWHIFFIIELMQELKQ